MKNILMSSIIAMTSAGIYGGTDFFHDLKRGTYIKYDRKGYSKRSKIDVNRSSLYVNDWKTVSTDDYSRGD